MAYLALFQLPRFSSFAACHLKKTLSYISHKVLHPAKSIYNEYTIIYKILHCICIYYFLSENIKLSKENKPDVQNETTDFKTQT